MTKTTDQVLDLLYGNSSVPDYNDYIGNPFGFITDREQILKTLNAQAEADYATKGKEALRAMNRAEGTAISNTREAVNSLRNNLAGATASGANRGAANASALQAMLGLGQQNNALITEGLQGMYKVQDDKAAALAKNAVDALTQSNAARQMQANAASERYNADATARASANTALSSLVGTIEANKTNEKIAKTTQKQVITNKRG